MLNKYNAIVFFNNSFFKKIGKYSFSIYLLHIPIFDFISAHSGGWYVFDNQIVGYVIVTFVAISVVFSVSYLTYNLIEKPFMIVGSNLIKKLKYD